MRTTGNQRKFFAQDELAITALSEIVQIFYKLMRDEDELWNKLTPDERNELIFHYRILRDYENFCPDNREIEEQLPK